jgi:hypothetical protein
MTSSTMATARSSVYSSPPPKNYNGGHRSGALLHNHQFNKRVSTANSGKPPRVHQSHHKRQNNDYPKHTELLDRLSLPSSSPSGTLLERIGGLVEDEVASTLTDSDRIDVERVSEGVDIYTNLPFSTTPHYYTPEPGEVERFLESVIGAPPAPPSPSPSGPGPVHSCLVCYLHLAHDTPFLFT